MKQYNTESDWIYYMVLMKFSFKWNSTAQTIILLNGYYSDGYMYVWLYYKYFFQLKLCTFLFIYCWIFLTYKMNYEKIGIHSKHVHSRTHISTLSISFRSNLQQNIHILLFEKIIYRLLCVAFYHTKKHGSTHRNLICFIHFVSLEFQCLCFIIYKRCVYSVYNKIYNN